MLSVFTLLLAAQSALLVDVPAGPKVPAVANTSNSEVWVAGRDQVLRLSSSGVTLLKVPLDNIGSITALAVDRSGRLAVLATDFKNSNFLLISPTGDILTRRQIDGAGQALVLDSLGFAFVAGRATDGFRATPGTYKTDFGPPACFGGRFEPPVPCGDAFVTRLRLDGTILWSTLLGGSRDDAAQAIGIDAQGAIWVAGDTVSSDLPTTPSAFQPSYGGGEALGPGFEYGDGFLARIDPSGTQLLYASYLGGSRFDQVSTITITPQAIILGGSTDSPNFPVTPDALQRSLATDQIQLPRLQADAFLAAVSHTGALLYATYYGGPGQQFASSSTIGNDTEVGLAIEGLPRRCVLKFDLRNATPSLRPDCFASPVEAPFTALFNDGQWVLAGSTKSGLLGQGLGAPGLVLFPFVFDNPLPAVTAVWADNDTAYRPLVSLDSWITIFTGPATNLNGASVLIAGRPLKVSYAGNGQINAYVPASIPLGTHPLIIALPFFNSIPVPVDVRADWPGLASVALNEDGSINSATNPARRGSIVSLFATGLGSVPLPPFEVFIQISSPIAAQGMELLFAGRIGEGLVQINARIPNNAFPDNPLVRIVLKDRPQYLGSNLARIFVD